MNVIKFGRIPKQPIFSINYLENKRIIMRSFNDNAVHTLTLVLIAKLISEYQAIKLSADEDSDQNGEESPEEEVQESEQEEGLTRGVDPARTRLVDPARTVVDPARTAVDPARTR